MSTTMLYAFFWVIPWHLNFICYIFVKIYRHVPFERPNQWSLKWCLLQSLLTALITSSAILSVQLADGQREWSQTSTEVSSTYELRKPIESPFSPHGTVAKSWFEQFMHIWCSALESEAKCHANALTIRKLQISCYIHTKQHRGLQLRNLLWTCSESGISTASREEKKL